MDIQFQSVVMGILTLNRQGEFKKQLGWLSFKDKTGVQRAAAMVAVRAHGYILRQRREKLPERGLG